MKVGMYEQRDGVLHLIATSDENGRFDPPVPLEAGIVYVKAYRVRDPQGGDQIRVLPINALRSAADGQTTDGS